jgi:tetratricopeptide (TPR) repeat protein
LNTISNLANVYVAEGGHPQAEALLMKVLEARSRVLGEQHPDTLRSMAYLAELYGTQGRYAQAEVLFAKVLQVRRRVLGPQHPDSAATLLFLGRFRLKQQRYAEAEAALRDALKSYETMPDDWKRYHCESMLGASLTGQKMYADAEPFLLAGYEGLVQHQATISAEYRPVVEEAKESILRLYAGWGKPGKAAEWKQSRLRK